MHFHFVSAHFGGPPPWRHHPVSKNHQISLHYYDDSNTPSRVLAMHPRLKAKVPKMLEWRFVNADWYVWLDSSIELNPNADLPANILKWSNGHPLCLFRHSKATSIQEEAQLILNQLEQKTPYFERRYQGEPIREQLLHYLGDPDYCDNRLFQMTAFAYHKSAAPLMQEWFLQNCLWSLEDQISFPYVLQRSGLSYALFPGTVPDNPLFRWSWETREAHLKQT